MTVADSEWRVEIDTGSGTLTPPVGSGVSFEPGINDIPQARVPVPASDRYAENIGPGATARLYYRGDKLPIDELVSIDRESDDQTDTLVLTGGLDLTDYRDRIVVAEGRAADAAADLLTDSAVVADTTPYAPGGTKQTETPVDADPADAARADEFDPVDDNGQPTRTAFTQEFETFNLVSGGPFGGPDDESSASAGSAAGMPTDTVVETTFTVGHRIPEVRLAVRAREDGDDTGTDPITVSIDGDPVGSFGEIYATASDPSTYDWYILGEAPNSNWTAPEIQPGDRTLQFEIDGSEEDRLIDVVSLYDSRVEAALTFDNNISNDDDGERVDGPEEYPDAADLPADSALSIPVETVRSLRPVTGTTVTVEGGDGDYTAELSTDGAETFDRATAGGSASVSVTDSSAGETTAVLARYGLAGKDSGSGTPATGNEPVSIDNISVDITTADRRVVQRQERRGELLTVLQDLAEQADALFEIGVTDSGEQVLRWDYPEQNRTSREAAGVASVSATVSNDDQAERVRVFGGSRDLSETVTFPDAANATVDLGDGYLVPGSETVTREDTNQELRRGIDYRIEYERDPARLVALAAGPRKKSPDVTISARAKIAGEKTLDGVSDPSTVEISGLSLQESFAAEQVARIALDDLRDPRREADLRVSDFDPRDSLLTPLTSAAVPFEPERVTSVSVEAGTVSVGLASRATAGDIIRSLRRRSEELARSV